MESTRSAVLEGPKLVPDETVTPVARSTLAALGRPQKYSGCASGCSKLWPRRWVSTPAI